MIRFLLVVPWLSGLLLWLVRSEAASVWLEAAVATIVLMSCGAALVFWLDKRRARQRTRRVPERVLWQFVLFGGAVGAWIAMRRWRHKTRKSNFRWGVPLCALLQVALLLFVAWAAGR